MRERDSDDFFCAGYLNRGAAEVIALSEDKLF